MSEIYAKSFHSNEHDKRNDNIEELSVPDQSQPVHIEEIEILGEQFQNYLLIAQALLRTLKRPRDIEICTILLHKVQQLSDNNQTDIRRNNNYFFRYFLRVLKWTSDNQPLELYQCWHRIQEKDDDIKISRAWLEENKSYMAQKFLNDGSTVIFGAISEDPLVGWQEGGLKMLAKQR